jgi:hypothetical protein
VSQLWALISYKKRKDDKWPQLKTREQLLQVWDQIKDRAMDDTGVQLTASDENEALLHYLL